MLKYRNSVKYIKDKNLEITMIKQKRIFVILIMALFFVSFISAQGCANEGWKGFGKIHENKTILITCTTCDFINFSATNPYNEVFLDNIEMNKDGSIFSYSFSGDNLSSVGTYQVDGYSNLDTPLSVCFDVTMTGNEPSIGTYFILILLSIVAFFFIIWINMKFDTKRRSALYDKIVGGYFNAKLNDNKNLGQVILFSLGYAMLKNIIVFYYLDIVFFLFMATELVESFGIVSLVTLFTTILNITLLSSVVIFIVMFFSFYTLIRILIQDIADMQRGMYSK